MKHASPAPELPLRARLAGLPRKRLALGLAGLVLLGGVGASALWTDTAQVQTTVTAGSIDILVDGVQGDPVPHVVDLGLGNAQPGDTATRTIVVRNAGTVPVRLKAQGSAALTGGGVSALADSAQITVTAGGQGWIAPQPLRSFAVAVGTPDVVVAPGSSVDLVATVVLPGDMPASAQGTSTTVSLSIVGEQA